MTDLELTEHGSFRELISQRGITPQVFKSNLEAMEAVELMATTCQLGDRVLALGRKAQISEQRCRALLLDLVACFADPVQNARRVLEIARELRGYEK